ncbi:hypothetical protein DEJ50_32040 [Streptomyces venezuelae]|uniref:Uncharacterized protein n=1 Tax=Streptomyces venezuelae TaxID=54571 RepID=A0A5P2DC51_STRVZ|nr:hypothetical protein DEJ50_32040 [Streptomyces venezuelae]
MPRKAKKPRRLVADGRTYLWSLRHRHRAPDGGRSADCRETLTLYPQPAGSRTSGGRWRPTAGPCWRRQPPPGPRTTPRVGLSAEGIRRPWLGQHIVHGAVEGLDSPGLDQDRGRGRRGSA